MCPVKDLIEQTLVHEYWNAIHGPLRPFHAPALRQFKRVSPKVVFFKSFGKSASRIFGTSRISCSLILQQTYRYVRTRAFLKKFFYLIFTALFSSKKMVETKFFVKTSAILEDLDISQKVDPLKYQILHLFDYNYYS